MKSARLSRQTNRKKTTQSSRSTGQKSKSDKSVRRTPTVSRARVQSQIGFDEACYQLLCSVPRGKVTTYQLLATAVAKRFGFSPRAVRAVGGAMNRNPDAPRVPCHRVVRSDGSLGGYAGGVGKKIALLQSEGINISESSASKNRTVLNLRSVQFDPGKVRQ